MIFLCLCSSLREFGYVVVMDTNPLDLVMEVASVILSFSYKERRGEEVNDKVSPSIDST